MNTNLVGRVSVRRHAAIFAIATIPAFLLLTSCGGGYGGSSTGGASLAPVIATAPASTTVPAGQSATFTVMATGFMPISYQWVRGGVDIAGATQAAYTLASASAGDNGVLFAVRVSNAYGTVTSASATLTVQ